MYACMYACSYIHTHSYIHLYWYATCWGKLHLLPSLYINTQGQLQNKTGEGMAEYVCINVCVRKWAHSRWTYHAYISLFCNHVSHMGQIQKRTVENMGEEVDMHIHVIHIT
jgi:hypothetical protein